MEQKRNKRCNCKDLTSENLIITLNTIIDRIDKLEKSIGKLLIKHNISVSPDIMHFSLKNKISMELNKNK